MSCDYTSNLPVSQGTTPWIVSGTFTPGGTQDVNIVGQTITLAISAASLPLPTGAATEATLLAAKLDLDKFTFASNRLLVDGSGTIQPISGTIAVSNFPAIQPVSQAGSWTVSLTSESIEIGTVDQGTPNAGGALAWPVVVSNFPGVQPISGTITANQGTSPWVVSGTITTSPNVNVHDGSGNTIASTGTSLNVDVTNTVPVTGTFFQATQPVSGVGNFTVVQPTGTNLHTVLDSGTLTGALPAGTNLIGHVITDSGSTTAVTGNVTVVQPTGTNLHTTVDNFPVLQSIAIDQTGDNNDVDVINGVGAAAVNIQDGGNSITVDGTVAVSNFPATQPVSGTVAATQSGEWDVNIEDTAGNALTSTSGALDVNIKSTGVTQPISGTVTANAGTNLNTSALALDATLTNATQKTKIVDTGGTNVASVDATGDLQVDVNNFPASQTINGTVTANQGTSPWVDNITQLAGNAIDTNSGNKSAGTLRVVLATDQPQLTNALKVDGSAVTQPVSGTVNVDFATGTLNNGAETAVAGSAVQVLAANANREKLILQNTGVANVRIGTTGVTNTTGFRLTVGATVIFDEPNCPTNAIFAIREGTVSSTVLAQEIV